MGILDFAGKVVGAAVKTAVSPIAITKDVVSIAAGVDSNSTKKLLASAKNDVVDAVDEIMP